MRRTKILETYFFCTGCQAKVHSIGMNATCLGCGSRMKDLCEGCWRTRLYDSDACKDRGRSYLGGVMRKPVAEKTRARKPKKVQGQVELF